MRAVPDIRERVKNGVDRANDATLKMILAMLEAQDQETTEKIKNEDESERRFLEYEQGKITPLSLDELEARVRKSHKERMKPAK